MPWSNKLYIKNIFYSAPMDDSHARNNKIIKYIYAYYLLIKIDMSNKKFDVTQKYKLVSACFKEAEKKVIL